MEAIALFFAIALVTLFYTLGIPEVPFHPDESTQLYMSQDLPIQLRNPWDLAWQPGVPIIDRVAYRLLDPPFTRLWLGFWLTLTQNPAPVHDWNWSEDWAKNILTGALPTPDSLFVARLGITLLLPLSLFSIWKLGKDLGGYRSAWIAFALLSSNALVLLHTRRAMAEGPLLAWSTFTLWLLSQPKVNPWLIGLSAGLAFNAKYTTLPLLILAIVVLWFQKPQDNPLKPRLRITAIVSITFILLSLALNPVLWKYPFQTLKEALAARERLLSAQITDFTNVNPLLVATSFPDRMRNLLLQVFFAPPQTSEAANYAEVLETSYQRYLASPIHHTLRGLLGGGFLLTLTTLGIFSFPLRQHHTLPSARKPLLVLIGGTLLQSAFILGWLPLTFQRYYIPLIPYFVLWATLGLDSLIEILYRASDQIWRK